MKKPLFPTRQKPLRLGELIAHPKTKRLGPERTLKGDEETNSGLIRALDDSDFVVGDQNGSHDLSALESDPLGLLGDTRALPISCQRLLLDHNKLLYQLLCTIPLHPANAPECTALDFENSSSLGRLPFLALLLG